MKKIKTVKNYNIYELTKEECKQKYYEYPTFAIFDKNYENIEECSVGTIEEAEEWCNEYGY